VQLSLNQCAANCSCHRHIAFAAGTMHALVRGLARSHPVQQTPDSGPLLWTGTAMALAQRNPKVGGINIGILADRAMRRIWRLLSLLETNGTLGTECLAHG